MTYHLQGKINVNKSRFLIWNWKKVTQYFSIAERKELSTVNSISTERILQEWKGNKNILKQTKLKNLSLADLPLKIGKGSSSTTKEMITEKILEHTERRKEKKRTMDNKNRLCFLL